MSVNEGTQHVAQWNVPYATDKRLYYNENLKSHAIPSATLPTLHFPDC